LLVSVSGFADDSVAAPLLRDVRRNILQLGDPVVSAALHVLVGEIEAKRGLVASATRHTRIGQNLLEKNYNVWLDAVAENNRAAISIMISDLDSASKHAAKALALAKESGAAAMVRAAIANIGNVLLMKGAFQEARAVLQEAYDALPAAGEHASAALDSLARVCLHVGEISSAEQILSKIEAGIGAVGDWNLYANRNVLLTRVDLLMRTHQWSAAAQTVERLLIIAREVSDQSLEATALLRLAEIAATSQSLESLISFDTASSLLRNGGSPVQHADYQLALAKTLASGGRHGNADLHRRRGERMLAAVGSAPPIVEYLNPGISATVEYNATQHIHSLSAVLMHAGRPELVATELMAVLQTTPGLVAARAIARGEDGTEEILAAHGSTPDPASARVFTLGTARSRTIELHLQPSPDLESHATLNAIGVIVAAVEELERARIEREERLTLWPVDELPAEDDDSVVTGRMGEVMLLARKVAQSKVTVIITGESGTGKEVLARAIHRYSPRSKKPFVPFNCTAVPRELLESQLFGYRRGAFTGADRDYPGLIRAAQDGTLFLDEIGELGLDLQPKLLRFLESGEIHPLGETTPTAVKVRIVAATNANLQQLVTDGRFREDLFYRLNVIPIVLPPLRERRDEIPALAQHFALKASHDLGKAPIRVGEELMEHLVLYRWPGNIRQLNNEISRMVAMAESATELTLNHLPRSLRDETEQLKRRADGLEIAIPLTDKLDRTVATLEREMIRVALRMNNGRVEAAAKSLGISRKGLYLKRQRLGL
jgi:DNA-binding NtrC family response regulator/tetratricopeptide (TPR) repeat protein